MIHAQYGTNVTSYLSLLESKIHTAVAEAKLRWLFKFTNDMTKTVKYCYGKKDTVNDRYVKNDFLHNTSENVFSHQINFKPYGYWSYEVYEVSWVGTVSLSADNAPSEETEVLEAHNDNGVVRGLVHEGKLYVTETAGTEQIKYTEHEPATQTNYLYAN